MTAQIGLRSAGARGPLVRNRRAAIVGASLASAATLVAQGVNPSGVISAGLAAVLVLVAITDLERRIIPNRVVLPALALVLLGRCWVSPTHAPRYVLAMLALGVFLLLPNLINGSAIGMGDVKLGALLGAGLGWTAVNALALGFALMFPVALLMVVRRGHAARTAVLPLAPFMAAGGLAFLIFGPLVGL